MSETLKILGQAAPAAASLSTLYTVPALTSATASSITICNQNTAKIKFRVSVAIGGAADSSPQYIFYDVEILGNATFVATLGITLAATDVVRVYADTVAVSFNLFGVEIV